jgi:hypothetical protein
MKSRVNSINSCHDSLQNFWLSICYIKKMVKVYKSVILSVPSYGCEMAPKFKGILYAEGVLKTAC